MTAAEEWFVDTNVLLYATSSRSPWHQDAVEALNRAREQETRLVISTQVLREYLVAATRPGSEGVPAFEDALKNVRTLQSELRVVGDDLAIAVKLVDLVEEYEVVGKQVHDANIVATMMIHGIERLLTHNVGDFARFSDVVTIMPLVEKAEREL